MKNQRKHAALIATGILIGSALGGGTALAASGILAERSTMPFIVNGASAEVEAYLIEGNNYLKLRDIAALADFGVLWNEGSGTVAIDTMVGYTPEAGTQIQKEEKETPSATTTTTTDYSAGANPAIFNSTYTREIYNALRQTVATGEASHTFAVPDEATRQTCWEVTAAFGSWPSYDLTNVGKGTYCFTTKYPDAYQEAATYCQPFIDSLAGLSDREKVRQIAFYVCDRLTYETGSTASPQTVLVDDAVHTGNCMAYAHNFQFLCDMAGIPNVFVHSEIHQWNEVFVENRWWSVDVGGTDVGDVPWRDNYPILHETSDYQGTIFIQAQTDLTRFAKELLVPGSTK